MQIPESYNPVAREIALVLLAGFDKHYRLFRECSQRAKQHFESGDWQGGQRTLRERIAYYDERVSETAERLRLEFHAELIDDEIWRESKLYYIGLLSNHRQPECAETFFNSVFCRILHRDYFNNDFIFIRPAVSTEYIESDPPTYRSYYPLRDGWRRVLTRIVGDFDWQVPFAKLSRDLYCLLAVVREHVGGSWPKGEVNLQVQVLASAFYRNKTGYIIGRVLNGHSQYPFAVPVLHRADGQLYLDTVILEPWRIGLLFSFSRAYFMVDMPVPSAYVSFLRSLIPNKSKAELYTMLGLQKQGKSIFYRDFIQHLSHSADEFRIAPGIRGLVMLVFTLPSFPYVFKVIRDEFGSSKEVDHATVQRKYRLVKEHDRVGRLADTWEFVNVAFPAQRFAPELIAELERLAPSQLERDGDTLVIRHLYIERRLTPLNLYLQEAGSAEREQVVRDYGQAIRELATANIFPGDMLFKNFGVTRYGRVIFYDYDEIEYLTDCNFRVIPEAQNPEQEMSGEVWYSVARNDVFPEEFASFLLTDPEVRRVFLQYHRELLSPEYWQLRQVRVRAGVFEDFFPYPQEVRFCRRFARRYPELLT